MGARARTCLAFPSCVGLEMAREALPGFDDSKSSSVISLGFFEAPELAYALLECLLDARIIPRLYFN